MSEGPKVNNAIVTHKESGSSFSNFQCPMLKSTNYTTWAIRMKTMLDENGLWEMIEPSEETSIDVKKDKYTIAYLFQILPEYLLLQVADCKTAREVWDSLKTRHIGATQVQEVRLQSIKSEFDKLQMKDDETIDSFTLRLTNVVSKATSCGEKIDQTTLVRKILTLMPDRFLHIIGSIEQFTDLKQVTVDDIIGRLKTYEERIKSKRGVVTDTQDKLLFTRHDKNEGHGKIFGSHGPKRFNASRKNWRDGKERHVDKDEKSSQYSHYNKPKKTQRDLSKVKCYKCKQRGHYANMCPQRDQTHDQSNLVEEDEEPTLLMAVLSEHMSTNESLWYLDNGASNHMTGNRNHFKELYEKIFG
ncbi:uncharacterized protein LOC143557415 [Bidens hawaiensis]|uniref:uncharacterized protein LOC143557415 n=1 Tax=Bidens hawaiensis TaxID=980011 RepID=UPI004049EF10